MLPFFSVKQSDLLVLFVEHSGGQLVCQLHLISNSWVMLCAVEGRVGEHLARVPCRKSCYWLIANLKLQV